MGFFDVRRYCQCGCGTLLERPRANPGQSQATHAKPWEDKVWAAEGEVAGVVAGHENQGNVVSFEY